MQMQTLVDDAVRDIGRALSTSPTEAEATAIKKIVEDAVVNAVSQSAKDFTKSAVVCCGPEADMAHKISEEVDRARYALIANLTSMR